MGIIEQLNDLMAQGIPENEIILELRQRGFSPREINDTLNQSKIKSAVSGSSQEYSEPDESYTNFPTSKRSKKVLTKELRNPEEYYTPTSEEGNFHRSQEYYPQTSYYDEGAMHMNPPQSYPPQEQYYEENPEYNEESYWKGGNTDEFIEIAEQVFNEKIKEIESKLDELNEIKSIAGIRLDHMSERVKRIEFAFDKLQAAILNRVGSYGNTLDSIKKEMSMIENSLGKIVKGDIAHSSKKVQKETTIKKPAKKKTASRKK